MIVYFFMLYFKYRSIYEIFKSNLIRWYNSIKNNDFTNYKILNI